MGVQSFSYNTVTEERYESMFQYSYNKTTEYGFSYERYVALSDTSIFDNPVSIIKVAAGLSALYPFFVDKLAHSVLYQNMLFEYDKVQKDLVDVTNDLKGYESSTKVPKIDSSFGFLAKNKKQKINIFGFFNIKKPIYFMNRIKNINTQKPIYLINKIKDVNLQNKKRRYLYFSSENLFLQNFIHFDTYKDIYLTSKTKETQNKYDNLFLKIYNNSALSKFLNIEMYFPTKELSSQVRNDHKDILLSFPTKELNRISCLYLNGYTQKLNDINSFNANAMFLPNPYFKIHDVTIMSPDDRFKFKIYENIYLPKERMSFEIKNNIEEVYKAIYKNNSFNSIHGKRDDSNTFYKNNELLYRADRTASVKEDIFGITDNLDLYIGKIYSSGSESNTISYLNTLFGKLYSRNAMETKGVSGKRSYKNVYTNKDVTAENKIKLNNYLIDNKDLMFSKIDKISKLHQNIYAIKKSKGTHLFDIGTFSITEDKNTVVFKNTNVPFLYTELGIFNDGVSIGKFNKDIYESDIKTTKAFGKDLYYDANNNKIMLSKYNKDTNIKNHIQYEVWKNEKELGINNLLLGASLFEKYTKETFDTLWSKKEEYDINMFENGTFMYTKQKSTVYNENLIPIDKSKKGFWFDENNMSLFRKRKSFEKLDLNLATVKERKSMDFFGYQFQDAIAYKESNGFSPYNNILTTNKSKNGFFVHNDLWITKDNYDMSIFRHIESVIKSRISIDLLDVDSVIRNNVPTDIIGRMSYGYAGMFIPVSKTRNQAYIDNINNFAEALSKDVHIDHSVFGSVIAKPIDVPDIDLFCDKENSNAYIEIINTSLIKDKIKTIIWKDTTATFKKKNVSYIQKNSDQWLIKGSVNMSINHIIDAHKEIKTSDVDNRLYQLKKDNIVAQENKELFLENLPVLCYYDYETWMNKDEVKANIENQKISLSKEKGTARLADAVPASIKDVKNLNLYYDKILFMEDQVNKSDLAQTQTMITKLNKDLEELPNDFRNWAWVYETPDPFEKTLFGIDELLLPENDTRYKDFEDIIFDKENMIPKNPVQAIDENTFVAKFPIRHPIPDYSEIGIVYLDVETDIMYEIFLKFYRIWQAKIFEFGTMTMTQSVSLIMEYMYAWIVEYFPNNKLKQALRVFRLIRWYGETSIIQNSQYIITYEYETLESKLNTGACLVPNDLDINDSMFVDASLGVIRNNPIYIGSYSAHVTFTINNKKNTSFTFSLSNTVGSVNIYINDELVDIVSTSALNLTYELLYTGEENTVKIEKTAANNLNGIFYIGNIKIPNGTFKDLSIEFDPTLKVGNKPLNEIAQKMINYANLYENREEIYDIVRKGNLGIQETYKRLQEYWEIHHQNKIKGKRLTIKEV